MKTLTLIKEIAMINRNTESKPVYLLMTLWWVLLAMLNYRVFLFCPLPNCSAELSKQILWAAAAVLTSIGVIITYRRRRNGTSTAVNVLLPFEIYALITYYRFFPTAVICFVVGSTVLALVYMFFVLRQRDSKKTGERISLKKRVWHGILGGRTIIAVCLLFFLLPFFVGALTGHQLYRSNVETVNSSKDAGEWTVKNKIDTIKLLTEDNWAQLDTQERLDVLGTVVNIEVRYLGLDHGIQLKSGILGESIISHYNRYNNSIVIDLEHLNSSTAHDALISVCHECYHSYQHEQVELYSTIPDKYKNLLMFSAVKEYADEFENYEDSIENLGEYYVQFCEVNARQYAEISVKEYYSLIEKCTSQNAA